jgi:hypothetical protein
MEGTFPYKRKVKERERFFGAVIFTQNANSK